MSSQAWVGQDGINALASFIDVIFPIGTIRVFADGSDPNTEFGGTWVQYAPGRVLLGAGTLGSDTYAVGDEGGVTEHTLLLAELPSHTHPINTVVGTANQNATGVMADGAGVVTTSSAGGGGPHANVMPYEGAAYWERTA